MTTLNCYQKTDVDFSKERHFYLKSILGIILTNISFCFYGISTIIDYCIVGFFLFVCVLFANKNEIGLLFASTSMFASILVLGIGGSFFRLYEIIFLCFALVKLKSFSSFKFMLAPFVVPFVWIIFGAIYSSGISGIISCVLTTAMVLDIKSRIDTDDKFKELFLFSIVIAGLISGVYGFFAGSTIVSVAGVRYGGAIGDPNYSCLYYLSSYISLLCCNTIKKNVKVFFACALFLLIAMTQSISGIIGLLVLSVVYIYIKKPRKLILILIIIGVCIFLFSAIPFPSSSIIGALKTRLAIKTNELFNGNMNAVSTGRTTIWKKYIDYYKSDVGLINKIFGGIDTEFGATRDFFVEKFGQVSHNTFIDMLFMIGVVGFLFVVGCFLTSIGKLIKEFKSTSSMLILWKIMMKSLIMYYSLSISILTMKFYALAFLI